MKTIDELIDKNDPAVNLLHDWQKQSDRKIEILSPSDERDSILLSLQMTTHSLLGSIAYDTGGVIIDDGLIRILGSGHENFNRNLSSWNRGKSNGFYLIADDVIGGFFAINGGALGDDLGNIYYFAPDSLDWEGFDVTYSEFINWAFLGNITGFYDWILSENDKNAIADLKYDECFSYFPMLCLSDNGQKRDKMAVPIEEIWSMHMRDNAELIQTENP